MQHLERGGIEQRHFRITVHAADRQQSTIRRQRTHGRVLDPEWHG
jgi:hypothetical protein